MNHRDRIKRARKRLEALRQARDNRGRVKAGTFSEWVKATMQDKEYVITNRRLKNAIEQ